MVRVKIIKKGLVYPVGKIMDIPKKEADEALKDGNVELIKGKNVKGVGFVEEKKEREAEANYIYSVEVLNELIPTEWTTKKYEELKNGFLHKVSFASWERYIKEHPERTQKNQEMPKEETITNKPWIRIAKSGMLVSELSLDFAKMFCDEKRLFYKSDVKEVVEVAQLLHDDDKKYAGFIVVKPNRFVTLSEKYCVPYIVKKYMNKLTEEEYEKEVPTSISKERAGLILASPQFEETIPLIKRIFSVPIPIIYKGKLTFPNNGYDERFCSWLDHNAPKITKPKMELDEAKRIMLKMFSEFCFEGDQDFTNAVAGFLTPFLRGLFPTFTTRTPFFFYVANRERAGKDYLAAITGLVLEGQALDESPISDGEQGGNKNDEFRKKVTACMMSGRRRFHSANNKGKINNCVLEGILTSKNFSDRILGKNELANLDNEIDFSASGNVGIRFTPDLANRCNFIKLFLDIEDANKRKFTTPNLHQWVLENRGEILSAVYCFIREWINNGSVTGKELFTSFPEWASICGGIMENAGYGSPCISNDEKLTVGGDDESHEMKALFELAFSHSPEKAITKQQLIQYIQQDENLFGYMNWGERKDQTRFGTKLTKFYGRVFSDIRLKVLNPNDRSTRHRLLFTKITSIQDKKEIFGEDYKKQKLATLDTFGTYLPLQNQTQSETPIHNINNEMFSSLQKVAKVTKVAKIDKLKFKPSKEEIEEAGFKEGEFEEMLK